MYLEDRVAELENIMQRQSLKIDQLNQEVEKMKVDFEEKVKFEKQIYNVKDLSKLLNVSPDHARKEYIHKGRVKAAPTSAGYEISRHEFLRVQEVVSARGKHYL